MKRLQYLYTVLIMGMTAIGYGQNKKDTIFIFKDSVLGTAQSIYFDDNKNSKAYDNISVFKLSKSDNANFQYSSDYFSDNGIALIKSTPVVPWKNWVLLNQYKGKYYVYAPCDFLYHFRISINDTTYMDWPGEGPIANQIVEQKKTDNRTYELKLNGVNNPDRKVIIHIIDIEKGIAVFEETAGRGEKLYHLMLAADKIKMVPLIVNNCVTQKQHELTFEEPDYIELLKK